MLFGVVRSLSTSEETLGLILEALFAMWGYRISWRHQTLSGVTPWRFPSLLWAVICFFIGPVGIVVELVAEVTTKPRLPSTLGRIPLRMDGTARLSLAGRQANPPLAGRAAAPVPPAPPTGPPPPLDEHGRVAAFGWYADPKGRHEFRYFDGRGWTQYVANGGNRSEDPV